MSMYLAMKNTLLESLHMKYSRLYLGKMEEIEDVIELNKNE